MSSVNKQEIERFAQMADQWWDEKGGYRILHRLNPVRLAYLRSWVQSQFPGALNSQLTVLDVGCGGGLVAIPLAKQGFAVTAIDAEEHSIEICRLQAMRVGASIKCEHSSLEAMQSNSFKIITALEVIEHVDNLDSFILDLSRVIEAGGLLFVSTINKTLKSLLIHKLAAEYVVGEVPPGTHDWNKFIDPLTMQNKFAALGFEQLDCSGLSYGLLSGTWRLSEDLSGNYIACFRKGSF